MLSYGVIDRVVIKQNGVTIYENVEYVLAKIIDAVKILETRRPVIHHLSVVLTFLIASIINK